MTSGQRHCIHAKFQPRTVSGAEAADLLVQQPHVRSAESRRVLYFPPEISFRVKRVLLPVGDERQKANPKARSLCEGSDEKQKKDPAPKPGALEKSQKTQDSWISAALPCSIMSSHNNAPSLTDVLSLKTSFL